MRPLSVLFFTTQLGGGGAESHALRVMNHLDRNRVMPSLAVTQGGGSYERFLKGDVELHVAPSQILPSGLGRLAAAAPWLRSLVKTRRPDLVIGVMDMPGVIAIGSLIGLRQKQRVAVCVQIPPSIEYARSRLGRRLILPSIRRAYPRADRVIALSHGVRGDLLGIEPSLDGKITVIHNACVDERILAAADRTVDVPATSRPVVLAAGRLTYQKGYPDMIAAFALVRQKVDAELWILGDGPERATIESQIDSLGLQDHVKLLGFRDDPQAFMRRATVFALSSRYEGFGNVIVEALACGAPVVATDCPHGPREILAGDRGGLLVPVGDRPAFANALVRVLSDPTFRQRLIEAGKLRSNDFTGAVIAGEYASEIERICGRTARDESSVKPLRD